MKLVELFHAQQLSSRREILAAQRAVARIFLLGDQTETKSGLKKWSYRGYVLLQQSPSSQFATKLQEAGINTKRVFWLIHEQKYLAVVVFLGKNRKFVLPKKGEEFRKAVEEILK